MKGKLRDLWTKGKAPIIALAALLVIFLAGLSSLDTDWKNTDQDTGWKPTYNADISIEQLSDPKDQVEISCNGDLVEILDGDYLDGDDNLDGSRVCFEVGLDGKRKLYQAEGNQVREISGNMLNFYGCLTGECVSYKDPSLKLHWYHDGADQILGECDEAWKAVRVSPNGRTVGFVCDGTAYLARDGQVEVFGKNLEFFAIADEGRYVYCKDPESKTFFVQRGMDPGTRMELPGVPMHVNRDLSQAIVTTFSVEEGVHSWLLREGRVLHDLGTQVWRPIESPAYPSWDDLGPEIFWVKDLSELLFGTFDEKPYRDGAPYTPKDPTPRLCRLGAGDKPEILFENVCPYGNAFKWYGGDTLYYCENLPGNFYFADIRKKKMKVLAEETNWVLIAGDGSGIYYREPGPDGAYYYREIGGAPGKLEGSEEWGYCTGVYLGRDTDKILLAAQKRNEDKWNVYAASRGDLTLLETVENASIKYVRGRSAPRGISFIHKDGSETQCFYLPDGKTRKGKDTAP